MRVSREEKERSRSRIIESASRLFRGKGVEGASVGDVMQNADLTHGGFYRHFSSKDALLQAALTDAFGEMVQRISRGLDQHSQSAVHQAFRDYYLSDDHKIRPESGCPAAALGGDVARASDQVKSAFGAGLKSFIEALSSTLCGPEDDQEQEATRELAMMVGAVMLARASDPATAGKVLTACRV